MLGRAGARLGALLTTLVLVTAVVVAVVIGVRHADLPFFDSGPGCTADVGGHEVDVDNEQAGNAALISAIAVQRGMPARAASIALATAFQESKLRNITYGDRDSLGLFQQRTSQGWGTREQVLDPVYAINAFYDALEKVPDYEHLDITVAAQKVQRSAYPDAYADHEADGRALASALTGYSPATLSCTVDDDGAGATDEVRADVDLGFGARTYPTTQEGRIEVEVGAGAKATDGWAVAQFLVARADLLHLASVAYDGRIWSRTDQDGRWRSASGKDAVGRGRVRVEVNS